MRKDFNKLLCERERHHDYDGSGGNGIRNDNHPQFNRSKGEILRDYPESFNLDGYDEFGNPTLDHDILDNSHPYEGLPSNEKLLGHKIHSKRLNENLSPLRRFLGSRVGQHWDKIYSEISKNLRKDKATNLHIFQHLWGYVEVKTRLNANGKIEFFNQYHGFRARNGDGWRPIEELPYRDEAYYIHPVTKILCKILPSKKGKKIYNWRWFNHPSSSTKRFYIDDNNIWFMVIFEGINYDDGYYFVKEKRPLRSYPVMYTGSPLISESIEFVIENIKYQHYFDDIFWQKKPGKRKYSILTKPTRDDLISFWGASIRAIGKFQLSKQDIKKFKLNELKLKEDKIPRKNPRNPNERN